MPLTKKRQKVAKKTQRKVDDQEILPPDLIIHILSKLPTKNLLKFKCVSKQWYNWISDPCCIGKRLMKDPIFVQIRDDVLADLGKLHFIVTDSQWKILDEFKKDMNFPENFGRDKRDYKIPHLYSCNGLICFILESLDRLPMFENICVCNPTTRELILLPRGCPPPKEESSVLLRCLSFGFGYLPSSQEYKVARLYKDLHLAGMNTRFEISTSDIICDVLTLTPRKVFLGREDEDRRHSLQWRTTAEEWPRKAYPASVMESVSVNGCLYWFATYHPFNFDINGIEEYIIVCFNLSSEKFTVLPVPSSLYQNPHDQSNKIFNFRGLLSLLDSKDPSNWKIWSRQEDHQGNCSWINTHTIDMSHYINPPAIYFRRVLSDQALLMTGTTYIIPESYRSRICLYYNTENKEFTESSIEESIFNEKFAVVGTAECLANLST